MNLRKWSNVELTAGTLLFLFCTVTALTEPVNPFPEDGWLASRSRIFEHLPGGDNYTPIAAPAFFYAATYAIRTVAGLALEQEFYFDSFLHHLLLFGTVVLVYLSHRTLGLRRAGIVASGILAVFIESKLLPQAFWSENLTVCLMSAVLFAGLYLLQNTHSSERRFRLLTILFGLLLAGLVVTRLVPILILPGVILLLRTRLPRQRVLHFALLASAVVLAVALAAMSANLYRYGRFELSNSVGRHLWNVVSPQADRMLADSPEYQLLRKAIPGAQGRDWWELDEPDYGPDLAHFTREELMRKMTLHGISRHPLLFVKLGAINFITLQRRCPARLGLHHAAVNPLHRDSMLPPVLGPFPLFERTLAGLHRFLAWIYRVFVYGVLLAGALAFFLSRTAALSRTLLFFAYVFLTGLYVSAQIEEPDGRYVLLYLPALALLASNSAAMLVDIARSARVRE